MIGSKFSWTATTSVLLHASRSSYSIGKEINLVRNHVRRQLLNPSRLYHVMNKVHASQLAFYKKGYPNALLKDQVSEPGATCSATRLEMRVERS